MLYASVENHRYEKLKRYKKIEVNKKADCLD